VSKTYYHISDTPGLTVLEPQVPHEDFGEPAIPRVCAAPSVEQCASAISHSGPIYAIDAEPDVDNEGVINWPLGGEVTDALRTGEVWYLSPVKCRGVK
jgi:hypothetical protein